MVLGSGFTKYSLKTFFFALFINFFFSGRKGVCSTGSIILLSFPVSRN